jgi:hypothetical protein
VYDFAKTLFSHAAFPQNQHVHVCGSHLYGCFQCRGQQGRMSDDAESLFDEVNIHVVRYKYKDTIKLTVCHSVITVASLNLGGLDLLLHERIECE